MPPMIQAWNFHTSCQYVFDSTFTWVGTKSYTTLCLTVFSFILFFSFSFSETDNNFVLTLIQAVTSL